MASEKQSRWFPEQSGRMTGKVRAVIVDDGRLVVVPERRRGSHSHWALPGGRIGRGETATEALVREVAEEARLEVVPDRLLYVAEVTRPYGRQDLNLIFLASLAREGDLDDLHLLDLEQVDHPLVLPPLVAEIARDHADGWRSTPRWLGNVWDASLEREHA
jgi:ADP-ribose pyrophosphatase YjhB (NUDIX family)